MSDKPASQANHWRERLQRLIWGIRKIIPFALGVLALLLAITIYTTLSPEPEQLTKNDVNALMAQAMGSATPSPSISSQVYQTILPSLVIIQSENIDDEEGTAIGSGVVVNDSSAILTALHVVADATEIQVQFADGTRSTATIAVEQPENDIAVLIPVTPPDLFLPATIGSLASMRAGDEVFAVGNPLGLTGSISAGVISGFDRSFTLSETDQKLDGLIQFDAAVNPGNSGGPLLNRYGQVIGIVTGLINPTEQEVFIGIGFAVPINVAASAAGSPAH
ncbi:MAG: trypsin-like peptidase domain-containing protein [Anaerolineales bacterium]|jgi:S1-C subfamily serine protease